MSIHSTNATGPIAVLVFMLTFPITYVIYAVIPWPEAVKTWFFQGGLWVRSFLPIPNAINSFLVFSVGLALLFSAVFSCWLYIQLLRGTAKIKADLAESVQDKAKIDRHRAEAEAVRKIFK